MKDLPHRLCNRGMDERACEQEISGWRERRQPSMPAGWGARGSVDGHGWGWQARGLAGSCSTRLAAPDALPLFSSLAILHCHCHPASSHPARPIQSRPVASHSRVCARTIRRRGHPGRTQRGQLDPVCPLGDVVVLPGRWAVAVAVPVIVPCCWCSGIEVDAIGDGQALCRAVRRRGEVGKLALQGAAGSE